jgi:uncharacterized peroxidase-related enzyme
MTDTIAPPITERISRLGVADEETAPARVKGLYETCRAHYGYVPNWIQALAVHPGVLQRFSNYYENLFNAAQGRLAMAEREMIAAVVSSANGCSYCTLHHTGGLATQTENNQRAQRIAHNYREVDLSHREKAMCDFAMKVTEGPDRMHDSDFEELRSAGLDDEEIFETLEIAAFFSFSNRLATPLAILPDSQLFDFQRA